MLYCFFGLPRCIEWGKQRGKRQGARIRSVGQEPQCAVVLGRDSVWGLQGDPVAMGRQPGSSSCDCRDREGTDGSPGSCWQHGQVCGQLDIALSSPRNLAAPGSGAAQPEQLSFTDTAGGKESKLNQMSGFQIKEKRFWVCTMAEV